MSKVSMEISLNKIKELGYSDFSKILLATVDINNKVVAFEKNKNIKSTDILE